MTRRKQYKLAIRAFMRAHYTDERLAWLLAHARAGKLYYDSCCCFVGIATWPGDHPFAVEGERKGDIDPIHNYSAKLLTGGREADNAYCYIGVDIALGDKTKQEQARRRVLVPMIRAEMRRRERVLEAQTRGMLDTLSTLDPLDVIELAAWTDAMDAGRGVASPCAPRILQEEK